MFLEVAFFGEETKNSNKIHFNEKLMLLKKDDKTVFFVYFVALEFVYALYFYHLYALLYTHFWNLWDHYLQMYDFFQIFLTYCPELPLDYKYRLNYGIVTVLGTQKSIMNLLCW